MTGATSNYPPEHWMKRAQEMQDRAANMKDPALKDELERIAQGYVRLAEHAKRWMARTPPQPSGLNGAR